MARDPSPSLKIIVAVIVAFALFVVAILARNFWLSLILGIAGAGAFAYAVFLLGQFRKRLQDEKDSP